MGSVCKNFLEHPSKCTYGQRCIFQHPTHDVRKRQGYVDMMQDNARYTAMRLFQDIKGSCSSAKDNGEDYVDPVDETTEAEENDSSTDMPNFSRDLFRSVSH